MGLATLSGVVLAFASVLVLLIAAAIASPAANAGQTEEFRPEVVLPLLVVAGVIAFLLALLACVAFLAVFHLTDYKQALGLPDGSIRAVIALGLVLIFAIVSIYLYGSTANVRRDTATNLPAEALPAFAPGSVISIVAHAASPVPGSSAPPATVYDVTTRATGTETSDNLARQLITLIGTLVAAITAFYFGTRSADTAGVTAGATAAVQAMGGTPRQVRIVDPLNETIDLSIEAGEELSITVATAPLDAALTVTVEGDALDSLKAIAPMRYVYTRGASPADVVRINFRQVGDPSSSAQLVVRKA